MGKAGILPTRYPPLFYSDASSQAGTGGFTGPPITCAVVSTTTPLAALPLSSFRQLSAMRMLRRTDRPGARCIYAVASPSPFRPT